MEILDSASSQKGQILLIVVLAAVVSLTVGLSAVSRTITNTRVSTEEANSQKALSAAEAGIEELVNNSALLAVRNESNPLAKSFSNNSTFTAASTPIAGSEILINDGSQILKDDGADIWFSSYPNFEGSPRWSGTLTVLWDNNDGCSASETRVTAAVEIVVIQGASKNDPDMTRAVYDPCSVRASSNGFQIPTSLSAASKTVDSRVFANGVNVTVANGFIARVIPLYANAVMGARVSAGPALPTQGYAIDSVGSAGSTKRSVRVFRGFPRVPIEYFPYNIFLP
ncbi:MAG: hypothetical protein HYW63_02865 [Candidatus Levybacteria bacterium]|nr:hypothetical protein [Candidatus Levybacteria bacterium]